MFELLRARTVSPVAVASMFEDAVFTDRCKLVGAQFVCLPGENRLEQFEYLAALAAGFEHVVWQCLPANLGFAAKLIPRLT